jgi:membrane AbrB-like protein
MDVFLQKAFSADALKRLAITLPIALAGALVFLWATLPVPWMLGAMCLTVAAALSGLNVGVPKPLRNVALAIVGSMIGTAFSPAILDHLSTWFAVILYNYAYLITAIGAGTFFFMKICRQDLTTAFFSSSPGGLMEMPFLCEAVGGDARFASMVHSVRVVIVVLAVPLYIRFAEAASYSAKLAVPEAVQELAAADGAILALAAIVGYLAAKLLRIPAPALVGPMLAGVLIHLVCCPASGWCFHRRLFRGRECFQSWTHHALFSRLDSDIVVDCRRLCASWNTCTRCRLQCSIIGAITGWAGGDGAGCVVYGHRSATDRYGPYISIHVDLCHRTGGVQIS